MKTLQIIAAAALLATSSIATANWDMPFFGNNSSGNSTNVGSQNGTADTDGAGSVEGSFTFGFKASGNASGAGTGNGTGDNSYDGSNGYVGYTPATTSNPQAAEVAPAE